MGVWGDYLMANMSLAAQRRAFKKYRPRMKWTKKRNARAVNRIRRKYF